MKKAAAPEERLLSAIFHIETDGSAWWREINGVTLKEVMKSVLATLTQRERAILSMRYGFDNGLGIPSSMIETGKVFNVCRGRIWQIERKALRKLRHWTRSRLLKPYLQNR